MTDELPQGTVKPRFEALSKEERDDLQRIQEEKKKKRKGKYAILIADKSSNTYVVHCKQHLAKQVVTATTTTKTNQVELTESNEEVITRHKAWMEKEKLAQEHNEKDSVPQHLEFMPSLPSFGATVKLHKQNQLRWMA